MELQIHDPIHVEYDSFKSNYAYKALEINESYLRETKKTIDRSVLHHAIVNISKTRFEIRVLGKFLKIRGEPSI